MSIPHTSRHHHSYRFYLVIVTLVVGGILLLLIANNDEGKFSLTSATVNLVKKANITEDFGEIADNEDNIEVIESAFSNKIEEANEVNVELSSDKAPTMKEVARIQEMELRFADLTAAITVNGDKLELNNLKEVNLLIQNFVGEVIFSKSGLSLTGKTKRIGINDLAFSSEDEIEISFSELKYQSLDIKDIELKQFNVLEGNGELKVAEKLSYDLEDDNVKIYYFKGGFVVDETGNSTLSLIGTAYGVDVSGDLLNFEAR